MTSAFLPYGRQTISESDVSAVVEVLRGDWLTTGPAVDRFETALRKAVGARHAVACASGTAALHLAMLAADIRPGDAVIIPAITFAATANAARYVGAIPIFADVDADTGLMEPAHAEAALERSALRSAAAIVPVHLGGQCADPVGFAALGRRIGATIIEDASHALGTTYETSNGAAHSVGGGHHASLVCFSFHPVKTVAMGEGGAVTTNDSQLARRLTEFRNHGLTRDPDCFTDSKLAFDSDGQPNPWYYEVQSLGFNYRASDLHCALGASQIAQLDSFIDRRRILVERYRERLAPLAPAVKPLNQSACCTPGWHLMSVLIDFDMAGRERAAVMGDLRAAGIGTQVHYIPVPWHPLYRGTEALQELPGAAAYYARTLSLPLFPSMTNNDVDRVVDALRKVLNSK